VGYIYKRAERVFLAVSIYKRAERVFLSVSVYKRGKHVFSVSVTKKRQAFLLAAFGDPLKY